MCLSIVRAVGVRGAGAVMTAGLAVYIARAFGLSYSGEFYFLYSTVAVLGIVTRLGAEQHLTTRVASMVREGSPDTSEVLFGALAANALTVLGVAPIIGGIFTWTGVRQVGLVSSLPAWPVLLTAAFAFNAVWIYAAHIRAQGSVELSTALESVLLPAVLAALMVASHAQGTPPSAQTVANAIVAVGLGVGVVVWIRQPPAGVRAVAGQVRPCLLGAATYSPVMVTNGLIVWAPVQALGIMGSPSAVGVYNASFRVTMVVGSFGVLIKGLAIRRMLEASSSVSEGIAVSRTVRASFLIAFGLAVASLPLVLWPSVVVRVFGPAFSETRDILPLMLLAQCANVGFYLVETRLVLMGARASLAVNATLTVVAALALPLFISEWGTLGAAWAFAVMILTSRTHMSLALLRPSLGDVGVGRQLSATDRTQELNE